MLSATPGGLPGTLPLCPPPTTCGLPGLRDLRIRRVLFHSRKPRGHAPEHRAVIHPVGGLAAPPPPTPVPGEVGGPADRGGADLGMVHQPPSSVFQVAWELLRGQESSWAGSHCVSGAGLHTLAHPPPLWASRTPPRPTSAAENANAWEQQGGGVSWGGPSSLRPHTLASHLPDPLSWALGAAPQPVWSKEGFWGLSTHPFVAAHPHPHPLA